MWELEWTGLGADGVHSLDKSKDEVQLSAKRCAYRTPLGSGDGSVGTRSTEARMPGGRGSRRAFGAVEQEGHCGAAVPKAARRDSTTTTGWTKQVVTVSGPRESFR